MNLVTGYDADGSVGGGPTGDHGTACAGEIGAIRGNSLGVIGVAPNAEIMPVNYGSSVSDIASAIDTAVAGDRIDITAGIHQITEMIVVDRPLIIGGLANQEKKGALPTILKGIDGLPFVIQVETGAVSSSIIRDLQI